ncbi:MAG: hypothetical protein HC850_15870, partial [Rhodomicrobium sp.]|nr:hypothetical protein [Rhodomicrobium sp.]
MDNLDLFRRLSALADLSEEERLNTLAAREADDLSDEATLEALGLDGAQPSNDEIAGFISPEARNFVIGFEVGSRTLYDRKYNRAIWPGGGSGVTIGIGYDIGVQSKDYLHKTWQDLLSPTDIGRYESAVGITGQRAKALCPQLTDIVIPWDVALEAYRRSTMPTFGRLVLSTFPNATELHPHSFGALFSLVFNRGSRLTDRPGSPTRLHMRNIRDHMASRSFDRIPNEFRAMKSIWAGMGLDGLLRRREAEAVLFEEGLKAAALAASAPAIPVPGSPESVAAPELLEAVDHAYDGDAVTWEVDTEETIGGMTLEASAPWDGVAWPPYEESPDYRHIGDYALKGSAFTFTGDDLEYLLKANSFAPKSDTGLFVFGLRGARLITDLDDPTPVTRQLDRNELILQEIAPDHEHLRCVMGAYNPLTKRLSAFAASTVPCRRAVLTYMTNQSSGNLTPAGLFTFTVDWHNKSNPSRGIPGCMHEGGRQKAVWRSTNNLRYDLADTIENHRLHGNNVHPGMVERSAEFSSFGCLVVSGNYQVSGSNRANGTHTGEWARFRTALGLTRPGTGDHGKVIDMVVLTGLEAAIASAARAGGQTARIGAMVADSREIEEPAEVWQLQVGPFFDAAGAVVFARIGVSIVLLLGPPAEARA